MAFHFSIPVKSNAEWLRKFVSANRFLWIEFINHTKWFLSSFYPHIAVVLEYLEKERRLLDMCFKILGYITFYNLFLTNLYFCKPLAMSQFQHFKDKHGMCYIFFLKVMIFCYISYIAISKTTSFWSVSCLQSKNLDVYVCVL